MRWGNLEKREQTVLALGGVVILVAVGYWGSRGPWEKYQAAKAHVVQARERLARAKALEEEVRQTRQSREIIEKLIQGRGPAYNLWTVVSRAVQTTQLTDRAEVSSRPEELTDASAVGLTLNRVTLEEVVNVLHAIHSSDSLVVFHRLSHLRPAMDGKGLECELILITPRA